MKSFYFFITIFVCFISTACGGVEVEKGGVCEKFVSSEGDWVSITKDSPVISSYFLSSEKTYKFSLYVQEKEAECEITTEWTEGLSLDQCWSGKDFPLVKWMGSVYLQIVKDGENLKINEMIEGGEITNSVIFGKEK